MCIVIGLIVADTTRKGKTMGLALIHPVTGDFIICTKGEGVLARALILAGYEPIGPKGQAAARLIRA